jgi:hypothetical protein
MIKEFVVLTLRLILIVGTIVFFVICFTKSGPAKNYRLFAICVAVMLCSTLLGILTKEIFNWLDAVIFGIFTGYLLNILLRK